jgi:hypothetical protein
VPLDPAKLRPFSVFALQQACMHDVVSSQQARSVCSPAQMQTWQGLNILQPDKIQVIE